MFTISPKSSGITLSKEQVAYYGEMPNNNPKRTEQDPSRPEVEHLALQKKSNGEYYPLVGTVVSLFPAALYEVFPGKFSVKAVIKVTHQIVNSKRVQIKNLLAQDLRYRNCFFLEHNFLAKGRKIEFRGETLNLTNIWPILQRLDSEKKPNGINSIDVYTRKDIQSNWATNMVSINQEILIFSSYVYCRLRNVDSVPYKSVKFGEYLHHVSNLYIVPIVGKEEKRAYRSRWKRTLVNPEAQRSKHEHRSLTHLPFRSAIVPVSNLPKPTVRAVEQPFSKQDQILQRYATKLGHSLNPLELATIHRPKPKPTIKQVSKIT